MGAWALMRFCSHWLWRHVLLERPVLKGDADLEDGSGLFGEFEGRLDEAITIGDLTHFQEGRWALEGIMTVWRFSHARSSAAQFVMPVMSALSGVLRNTTYGDW